MLHILNGDSVAPIFVESGIGTNYVVWRELLCQGPTSKDLRATASWKERADFLSQFLGISSRDFISTWPSVIRDIEAGMNNSVTLWFEYDLFCQINCLAAVSLVHDINPNCKVYLIMVGQTLPHDQWITLGHLEVEDWKKLYPVKKLLTKSEKDFITQAWNIYCSTDHRQFDDLMTECPPVLKYLPQGIENHYRRFHSALDGFTDIQRYIFYLVQQEPQITEKVMIRKLLAKFHYYGYGDLQYKAILKSLEHLVLYDGDAFKLDDARIKAITPNELTELPTMTYGGQSNKVIFMEDFILE